MADDACQPSFTFSVDHWLRRAQARSLRILWSSRCVLCGGRGKDVSVDLCSDCETDLLRNSPFCRVCSEPMQGDSDAVTCGRCLMEPPIFDACCAPFRYAYPLDHLIRRFKYAGELASGRVLAEAFVASIAVRPASPQPEVLVPVPLGEARFRRRGFNQAIELATHIGGRLNIPIDSRALVRTRETQEQAGLDRRERKRNLRDAFAVRDGLSASFVAIVDDVVTTGSTANEVARVLKDSGVERVEVWAIARAGRPAGSD